MVRNYIKKTNRCGINEENMKKALKDISNGTETQSSAAEKYGIKRTTLIMRMKKKNPIQIIDSGNDSSSEEDFQFQSKWTARQIFTKQEESDLVEYVKKCSFYSYGLSYQTIKKFAYDYSKANGISIPAGWENYKEAGDNWLYGFRKRNPTISLRKPEKVSLARLIGFTKSRVEAFYANLATLYGRYSFQAKDIYNLDETGVTTVMDSPKIFATKGKRTVSQASSAERGSLVTMVGIVNASGNRLPPAYIFPRIRFNERFGNGCFPGTLILNSKSGWMMAELFIDVLKHIKNHTRCSVENPILVVLDNHSSHCSLETITYSQDNGIVLLSFPPHTSHRLQPLDVSVFGPFKRFCRKSFNDFMTANPGRHITIYDLGALTNLPFQRSFSSENIMSGFKASGIYPFNTQMFNDDDFTVENSVEDELLPIAQNIENNINLPQNVAPTANNATKKLTPLAIRPIPRLHASNKTARQGVSRILTSSAEKQLAEELTAKKNCKEVNRALKFSQKKVPLSKKKRPKGSNDIELESSDESECEVSYAESIDSIGMFNDDEYSDVENILFSKLTDDEKLVVGDYVLVKFSANTKKPFFYVGEVMEVFSDFTFNVNYLRRASTSGWVFVKPVVEDIALTLRSEIESKLPSPENPAATSRCRTKYIFNVDFGNYYVK